MDTPTCRSYSVVEESDQKPASPTVCQDNTAVQVDRLKAHAGVQSGKNKLYQPAPVEAPPQLSSAGAAGVAWSAQPPEVSALAPVSQSPD